MVLLDTPLSLLAVVVTHQPEWPAWTAAMCTRHGGKPRRCHPAGTSCGSTSRTIVCRDYAGDVTTICGTAGKGMYKSEPVVADEGEVIIYAPHVTEVSRVHGRMIDEVGYHCRDYFLAQWDRFKKYPGGILAHSTHVKGNGTYDAATSIEDPRVQVTLATGISPEHCALVNLGYKDPASVDPRDYDGDAKTLVIPRAGELLYRVGAPPVPADGSERLSILVDENVAYARESFGRVGSVRVLPGRRITAADVGRADVLIVRSVTRVNEALLAGSSVKFVGTATIGCDHVDVEVPARPRHRVRERARLERHLRCRVHRGRTASVGACAAKAARGLGAGGHRRRKCWCARRRESQRAWHALCAERSSEAAEQPRPCLRRA